MLLETQIELDDAKETRRPNSQQAKQVLEQAVSTPLFYYRTMHYESEVDKMIGELKGQSSLQSTEEKCSENTSRDTKKVNTSGSHNSFSRDTKKTPF